MKKGSLALVLLAGMPVVAQGQACLGTPIGDGQFAVAGNLALTDGARWYGGEFTADLVGPFSLGAGYSLIDVDNVETKGNSFGAGAAYEVAVPAVSLCPTTRVVYSRFHEEEFGVELTISQIVVPVGVGVGTRFAAGRVDVTLFGQPQFLWIRTKGEVLVGGDALVWNTENDSEFGLDLGARLSGAAFYAGAAVRLTSIENSEPVYTLSLGLVVGRRR